MMDALFLSVMCYVLVGGEESTLNLAALRRLIEAEKCVS